jgi:hypothetical protein
VSWLRATPDLLEVARAALRENVLPRVAPEGRYDTAMVANAVGIAVRELAQGAAAREAERADLGALLGDPDASLDELRARLCREIRAGRLPQAAEPQLREILLAAVGRRLATSNPDHLARHDA